MITVLSLDTLIGNALAKLRVLFPNRSTHAESWLGKQADAVAGLIWSVHDKVQQADYDATPQGQSTYEALALWAFNFGLPDGAGGFGPKGATPATGLTVLVSGTPASAIWNGVAPAPTLAAPDGTLFAMTAAANIGGGGTASINVNATTVGTVGNLTASSPITFTSSIPGVTSAATVSVVAASAGADKEGLKPLLARLLRRLQTPPRGGVANDWRTWAEGAFITSPSALIVFRAFTYPLRNGTGTVDEVISLAGSGAARAPSGPSGTAILAAVAAAFDANRLVCVEGRRALAPDVSVTCAVILRATPTTGNAFDWNSAAGGPYAIDAGGIVDATHYRLTGLAPADLTTAITAGSLPRIQYTTTASVLPVQAQVTGYANAMGKTTLTLSQAPAIPALAGDPLYAGGAIVATVSASILALVDSLGPSKASGYADPLDSAWDDTVRIDKLVQIAMAATVNADGTGGPLVQDLPALPQINGASVNVAAHDYGASPQLLVLSSVAVTP